MISIRHWIFSRSASLSLLVALAGLGAACRGPDGPAGPEGPAGSAGMDGMDGVDGTDGTVDPSLTPVEKAFAAIGGQPLVEGLVSFSYDGSGTRWIPGEALFPEDDLLEASTFDMTVTYDVAGANLRIDYDRFLTLFGLNIPLVASEILAGDLGVISGVESFFGFPGGDMLSDRHASTLKAQRLMNPVLILADIAADPTIATSDGAALLDGSLHHLVVVDDPIFPITLWVNAQNGRIDRLSTVENDWARRDSELDVYFYGWQPSASGLLFPTDVWVAFAGEVVHGESRGAVTVNGTVDPTLFDFPPGAAPTYDPVAAARGEANHEWHQNWSAAGLPLDGAQVFVMATELQPGVWHLTGGSHHSMIVEQTNGLVLLEAPLDDARAEAVAAWAATTYPAKPITHVVATHHHDDHIGGLRTFVALGATVVVGAVAEEFHASHFRAASTVYPDALELAPVAANIVTVGTGDTLTLPDATRPVELYDVDNIHAAGLLMAYLPVEQIVFESDLYNPGFPPVLPWSLGLHGSIVNDWGLSVTTIAGGHGVGAVPFATFLTDIGM